MNHSEIVSFLWGVADLIRDSFKRGKYQDVILPLTVLRRLDCVLAPTKAKVLRRQAELRGRGLDTLDPQLRRASGFAFYNTSRYDFETLLADAPHLAANLRNYIAGFSRNMREVLERFDFDNTISKLEEAGLLFQVLERFRTVDLHPGKVDNPTMGTIFEELIRKFNEALDENPGEHFTPRDVVHLMVDLMLAGDEPRIAGRGAVRTVYDPCCGSGGMLMIAKEHITEGRRSNGERLKPPINAQADIHLFGQEVNPETWAVSKSDFFMKDPTGRDADNVAFGSTLSNDRHASQSFDYLIANPPYGKDWKRDKDTVIEEHERGATGRFGPGLPRISDGQTLFLLHMLARAKSPDQGGARIAIIMNGSPLFTGDAGSGESEIRRFILENDLLEALIALPEQLFYNTGIATYVWLLTNRKAPERRGLVQLIDATAFWSPMRRSLGDKRREIPPEKAEDVLELLADCRDGETCMVAKDGKDEERVVSHVFPTTRFGFRRITVERPLRLNFQASEERIARLHEQRGFQNLAKSKKRGEAGAREEADGRERQQAILDLLNRMPDTLHKNREAFVAVVTTAAGKAGVMLRAPVLNAILAALAERDETAEICLDKDGRPEPDPELRDTERVPLPEGEDPADDEGVSASVRAFFEREVKPHVPDAWIDTARRDHKDGLVGHVGYEINFNRYFYRYVPPRPLEEIEADIQDIEKNILEMLKAMSIANHDRQSGGRSALTHEYGRPVLRMALGDQHLFPDDVSAGEEPWQPLEPEPTTVLWRYMSFAKFCSLLEQHSLFFSLVKKLQKEEDRYEGFICPPPPRHTGDRQIQAEHLGREVLLKVVQANLVNCWVNSEHESSLMWKSYAGTEGVAIRTTFQELQEAIHSLNPELPVTFGKVDYVDYRQQTTPRFRWAPLFHKREEFRGEEEVRAVLPCPPWDVRLDPGSPNSPVVDITLDSDVAERGGRYIPVDLQILVREIVVSPRGPTWLRQLVQAVVNRSSLEACVTLSTLGPSLVRSCVEK